MEVADALFPCPHQETEGGSETGDPTWDEPSC